MLLSFSFILLTNYISVNLILCGCLISVVSRSSRSSRVISCITGVSGVSSVNLNVSYNVYWGEIRITNLTDLLITIQLKLDGINPTPISVPMF
jgi:hypothetical protein